MKSPRKQLCKFPRKLLVKFPGKRTLVQFFSAIGQNAHIAGFFSGTIYTGKLKTVCVPGLNCYSCPGALGSCPIGALQAVASSPKFSFSFYITGLLMLFGAAFGRFVCGFLCPFGFFQELLHKIRSPKPHIPLRADHTLRYAKYLFLLVPVLLLPAFLTDEFGLAPPYFCQLICPAGTFEAGIPLLIANESLRALAGVLFTWKMVLLVALVVGAVLVYRPFCKYICPLGAFYAVFNRFSAYRMEIDSEKCTNCKACERRCKMQVRVTEDINSPECIRCGDCQKVCPHGAISSGFCLRRKKRDGAV